MVRGSPPGRPRAAVAAVGLILAVGAPAAAQPEPVPPPEPPTEAGPGPTEDDDLGPVIEIEAIEIVGNVATADRIIRRALPFSVGDAVHAGAAELRAAKYKVLALGFFHEVDLAMRRGSARGRVVVRVVVVERGTVALNRLWFGSSSSSVAWFGLDLSERNLVGTGLTLGGGAIYALDRGVSGGRDQRAAELRLGAPSLLGTRLSAFGTISSQHGSEPYRVAGALDDDDLANFQAFPYWRLGARGGAGYDVSALTRLSAAVRLEAIGAAVPIAPTRVTSDGAVIGVPLHLRPGRSDVVAIALGFDRDTRPDPVLPHEGDRAQVQLELGSTLLGGDYDYAALLGRYDRWWPRRDGTHAVGLRLTGGLILGDAPRFERLHLGDVNRMVTPRALGLAVATGNAPGFLGTRSPDDPTGEVGGSAMVEYVARLFRGGKRVFGGDLFVGGGLWMLADRVDLRVRDAHGWAALPIDLVLDAGLRVDTELGVFELTLANALGRVPL